MTEFKCPKCGKPIIVIEINSKHFKYKVACFHCKFYDWVDELIEIKPINHPL